MESRPELLERLYALLVAGKYSSPECNLVLEQLDPVKRYKANPKMSEKSENESGEIAHE